MLLANVRHESIIKLLKNGAVSYSDSECIAKADILLSGNWVADNFTIYFEPEIAYDVRNINWDIIHTNSPNTFSQHLQTLNYLYFLAVAFSITGKMEYYQRGIDIVTSWENYSMTHAKTNIYTWHPMTVALRLRVFILFYIQVPPSHSKNQIITWLLGLVKKHGEWLLECDNYAYTHNYGIMQDTALLACGYLIDNQPFIDCALKRFNEQMTWAYPNKAAHIENSMTYSRIVMRLAVSVCIFLKEMNNPIEKELYSFIKGATDFFVHAASPVAALLTCGDTYRRNEYDINAVALLDLLDEYEIDGFNYLRYALTGGLEGTEPEVNTKVFHKDGYAIIRSGWERNATWITFKSGYLSCSHKHKDELSFVLNAKGSEIFIDPGMYNYMVGNINHDYLLSGFAHNGIIVDGKSYPIAKKLAHRAGIFESCNPNIVTAFNNLYPGVFIDRSLIYVNESEFYIVDDIVSYEEHEYSQNFHLSNEVSLSKHTPEYAVLRLKSTLWNIVILQHVPVDTIISKYGETGDITTMSVQSVGMNTVMPTVSIQFKRKGRSVKFVTKIIILSDTEWELFNYVKK